MKMKRLFATIMAMVMLIAMTAMPVSATTFSNLTLANGTQYTTQITSTTTETVLFVQKLGDDWTTIEPFTQAEAETVTWTWPYSGSNNFVATPGIAETYPDSGLYYATLSVKKATNAVSGAYSVRANWGSAYIDLTLVIPSSDENATVKVYIDGTNTDIDSNSFTVTDASVEAEAGNYGYTTPLTALARMKVVGDIAAYSPENGDYINSITKTGTLTKTASGWYGWQYRVYYYDQTEQDYIMYGSSQLLGASAFKLSDGDVVAWYYGPYSTATDIRFNNYDFINIFQ
jgi:hypothetical protein